MKWKRNAKSKGANSPESKLKSVKGKLVRSVKASQVTIGTPEIRDPLYNPETLYLPYNIQHINAWIRHYDKTHPVLGNCIDIHAYLPISPISIQGIEDPKIKNYYEYVAEERVRFYDWMLNGSREYEMLGEKFSYFAWNDDDKCFDAPVILNPDNLEVTPFEFDGKRTYVIDMEVPKILKDVYARAQQDERFLKLWNSVPYILQECVMSGKSIPLSPNNVYGMQRLQSPYHYRGTSQVFRVLKDVLHEDKLREAQMATADGHITPIEHWKIGDIAQGYMPNDDALDDFQSLLSEGDHNNYNRYVTHSAVSYNNYVPSAGMLNIIAEMDKIQERILTAMHVSSAWTGGDGPTYSNSVVALKVIRGRYKNKTIRFENIIKDIYRKIAYAHGFYQRTQAELVHRVYSNKGKLIVPEIKWADSLAFNENFDLINMMIQLADKHKLSWQTVLEELGKDPEAEKRKITKEATSIFSDPVLESKINKILEGDVQTSEKPGGNIGGAPTNLSEAPQPPALEDMPEANVPQAEPAVTEV